MEGAAVRDMRASMRLVAAIVAACMLLVGAAFVTAVEVNGARWINRAYNTRISDARKTTVQGAIFDSEYVELAASGAPGERHYIADAQTRRALSHTLGDQTNMSYTGVENFHASTLLGFTTTRTGYTLQRLAGYDPVGNDIVLTVNAALTRYIAQIFPQGKSGAVAVINYKTGAILAMVSMPNFDPANMQAEVIDTAYYNRVLQKRYAPGSTFKIITLASALKHLPGAADDGFSCSGVWNYSSFALKCAGQTAHGQLTLMDAFAKSCNVTFGMLAYQLGAKALKETAAGFGFGDEFAFEDVILNESRLLGAGDGAADVIQAGIGQGTTEVTPLHMAMIAGAIANGGVMMEPKLIGEIRNPAGYVTRTLTPKPYKTAVDAATAETIARYMYEAVKSGTASRAAISGYKAGYVCGKTGSAEWTNDKDAQTNAWYAGFLYGDEAHPYAIAIVVEQGGAGGTAAAPIASKALSKAMDLNLY